MAQHLPATCDHDPGSGSGGLVAIIASAGGIPALFVLLRGLGPDFSLPIIVAQHLARGHSNFAKILMWRTGLNVRWLEQGDVPREGQIYVVPPGQAARITASGFAVSGLTATASGWLSSPDVLFNSMAEQYGAGAVAIVLSGMLPVAIEGMRAVRARGGVIMAQSTKSADYDDMPAAAIDFGKADLVLTASNLARALRAIASMRNPDSCDHSASI